MAGVGERGGGERQATVLQQQQNFKNGKKVTYEEKINFTLENLTNATSGL